MAYVEKILVVDDEPFVRDTLAAILETNGFAVRIADSGEEALSILESEFVSLVISDVRMPGISGFELLAHVLSDHIGVEVILITGHSEVDSASVAVEAGAYDFISKPFRAYNVILSVRRALEKRMLVAANRDMREALEKKLKEQALSHRLHGQEKTQLLNNMIMSFVHTLEAKDKYTEGHSHRVADAALLIAQKIGLTPKEQEEIHLAGLFHDIGKIGVPESILNKHGVLTPEEFEIIKTHVTIGVKILSEIPQFRRITPMIRGHHEYYDGTGYPDGLVGDDIPLGGRILAVCDAYDAMSSDRPYRRRLTTDEIREVMIANRGTQFDAALVEIFLRSVGLAVAI
ncbi:response regulator [bacterium]|nr:response regulator [bacterium]